MSAPTKQCFEKWSIGLPGTVYSCDEFLVLWDTS